jgi:hypothetical protein
LQIGWISVLSTISRTDPVLALFSVWLSFQVSDVNPSNDPSNDPSNGFLLRTGLTISSNELIDPFLPPSSEVLAKKHCGAQTRCGSKSDSSAVEQLAAERYTNQVAHILVLFNACGLKIFWCSVSGAP